MPVFFSNSGRNTSLSTSWAGSAKLPKVIFSGFVEVVPLQPGMKWVSAMLPRKLRDSPINLRRLELTMMQLSGTTLWSPR
jgi:hypothetical protein